MDHRFPYGLEPAGHGPLGHRQAELRHLDFLGRRPDRRGRSHRRGRSSLCHGRCRRSSRRGCGDRSGGGRRRCCHGFSRSADEADYGLHRHGLPFFHQDLQQRACRRGFDLVGDFVRRHLEQNFAFGHRFPHGFEPAGYGSFGHCQPELRHFDF